MAYVYYEEQTLLYNGPSSLSAAAVYIPKNTYQPLIVFLSVQIRGKDNHLIINYCMTKNASKHKSASAPFSSEISNEFLILENGTQRSLPVPEIFWKVVYNPISQRSVALIGVNNPYKTAAQINRFCDDRSDLLPWLNWQRNNQMRGISWACTVTAFRRIVNTFPDIEIRRLLF
ncbi:hypothetical protein HUJ04_009948 [Dendroctonus ponderosae]|nr:hypothetical protein HUJ04_009948 [Dendroctonus ponderosae]